MVAPPACREHRTAPEPLVRGADIPPENVRRLHVLTDAGEPAALRLPVGNLQCSRMRSGVSITKLCAEEGILRSSEFAHLQWDERDRLAPLSDILRVHEWNYVRKIQVSCTQGASSEARLVCPAKPCRL